MENEFRKRPYCRILILWIAGICLAAYLPEHILFPIFIPLCFGWILLLFLSHFSSRNYPLYEQRGDWGILFSFLFLMLAIEYTYFRLRIPALNLAMPLLSFCQEWQTRLLSTFDPLPLSDSEKSILGAICYGYKQSLSPEMRQQFSMAGAAHILAVSGFHVGVVYSLLRTIGKQPPFPFCRHVPHGLYLWSSSGCSLPLPDWLLRLSVPPRCFPLRSLPKSSTGREIGSILFGLLLSGCWSTTPSIFSTWALS